ncbi:hypothetical protein [Dysgonomonas termitidis]|uniref:DUF1566 domain-containing protein n=1 Tax=Dysgonomonas termitidis TaxID=1516126 RepID=A0ABV9KZW1_9BACT
MTPNTYLSYWINGGATDAIYMGTTPVDNAWNSGYNFGFYLTNGSAAGKKCLTGVTITVRNP